MLKELTQSFVVKDQQNIILDYLYDFQHDA